MNTGLLAKEQLVEGNLCLREI